MGDINNDKIIDRGDLIAIITSERYNKPASDENDPLDVNKDGKINFEDLSIVRNSVNFGKEVE